MNKEEAMALSNAEYWRRYGDNVLMAMPYADQVLVKGNDCIVTDADGNELLDLASGMFCCVLGHNHPAFIRRIVEQTQALLHTGTQYLSPAVLEAGYKLAEVARGGLSKTIFLSTGTEANEFAFRLAKAYTGRTGIVGFSRGYYGTSLATKSVSSLFSHGLKDSLPVVPDSYRLPITSECIGCFTGTSSQTCDFPCLRSTEDWIGDWSNVAAVIVEPVMSAGGMLIPPPGYLQELRRIAHRRGALLIADEAQTGFGRTGKWFAVEHHGVEPDILTISKSAGNGFPVAAVTTTPEIADRVVRSGLWNLTSHQSDPVGAAAVAAVIDIVREENLVQRAHEAGNYFMEQLRGLAARHSFVGNVRGQGLMIGFDLLVPDASQTEEMANDFMYGCRQRGVHLTFGYGSRSFRVIPPLTISFAHIDRAIEVMDQSLAALGTKKTSKREDWPKNPSTRELYRSRPVQRVISGLWRSAPVDWVRKAKELAREK
ncbi:MAG TPA: aspartate aminotransferase family protein [Bryobacteraceae bacterium]|nr:aspartate aminotransferase family protein [Bryobacteraceae bacterium]